MDSVLSESLIGALAPPPEDYSSSETASCLVKPSSSRLFTANHSKRYDQQAPAAISCQAKFRVAALSIYAQYQFINGIEHLDLDLDSHDEEQTETTEEAIVPSLPLPNIGSHADTGNNVSGHVGPCDSSLEQGLRPWPLGIDANIVTDRPHHAARVVVTTFDWIFPATGLGFEAVSAFFDQVSSPQKPDYALYGMLLSIVAVLVCTLDLIRNALKPRRPASGSDMLWRILPEVFGLALACFQCISSALRFSFICRHAANPVKVSLVPFLCFLILFAFKYRENERN